MKGPIAIHSTHEAAEKLGGIGTVLAGLLPEPAYRQAWPQTLLVGVYPFPAEESLIDDPEVREAKGWAVRFDSQSPRTGGGLQADLASIADWYGLRLVFGERAITREVKVPVLLASPQGLRRAHVESFRDGVRDQFGFDLRRLDDYPALTDGVDRRLARILSGSHEPDQPERLVVDSTGRPFPGGAAWADDRAVFPPLQGLDNFASHGRGNKYLLELQYHTFAAPALWAATRRLLREWAPAGEGYDAEQVTLFAHDWIGVPLFWAARVAGDRLGRSVYFAHECRIFRLLAEGALQDRAALLGAVCHPEGHDCSLYPHLAQALDRGWDLATMYPGSLGFSDLIHHAINREADRFDRIVAVGPLVRDETAVALRPPEPPEIALCPNGIPAPRVTAEQAWEAHERLAEVAERALGFRPEVIVTGMMRCELSKAPWRNVGFLRRLAELVPERKIAFFWLSAPRPRPTRAQVRRWAANYQWPLDHRGGEGGDLRSDETPLWQAIRELNRDFRGQAGLLYINQFGWSQELLGALEIGEATFGDLRVGSDLELGLSIYEPFGIAPLEPFAAGTTCLLSDACGCARHLAALGLDDLVVTGWFTDHDLPSRDVDRTALHRLEQEVYDGLVEEVSQRLALDQPLDESDWLTRRQAQIARAQEALPQLSWANALAQYLLPAVR
ncbi:MAG: hypothetical protein HUU35_04530 [Armatimonadetes bacterium]|nr:hypothetical protein [Armatimonadota bacterium]